VRKGRDFGVARLEPRQISTGDRTILGKISRQGNRYLRVLFVQAAWVVLPRLNNWDRYGLSNGSKPPRSGFITTCWRSRWPKLARMAWAILNKERNFEVVRTTVPSLQPV
jgi:hypothetical protein